ncbi:MAG: hypothetical protein Q8M07_28965 [Prosthecobacter sp.]|nr:hypothetical protein [Prosthecobacter sp.]
MTKLLKDAIEKVQELSEERQNELAEMLMTAADSDLHPYQLNEEELDAVQEARAQVARGEFASDHDMAALWGRFGL